MVAELGPVDILVNNAGVSLIAPIGADDYWRAWDATIAVNLAGYVRLVRACLPHLSRNGAGRIVNIASTEGLGATPYLSPYTVSKHGVVGLTEGTSRHWKYKRKISTTPSQMAMPPPRGVGCVCTLRCPG